MKKTYKILSAALVLGVLLVFTSIENVSQVEAYTEVEEWKVYEITLTSQYSNGHYDDPMRDVKVTATFNGPGGVTIVRPGFWYDDNVWKVRFAPTETGN